MTAATLRYRAIARHHSLDRKDRLDVRMTCLQKIKPLPIEFSETPFRKLKGFQLPIAKRITVVAGHKGIGISTIPGLLANASGNQP